MKNIKEGLDRKHLWEITRKYNSSHRRHRYELVEKPRKQVNITFVDAKLAIKVIKDCRTTVAHKFRTRLGFKQYNVILTKKKKLVLTKIMRKQFIWKRKYANTL